MIVSSPLVSWPHCVSLKAPHTRLTTPSSVCDIICIALQDAPHIQPLSRKHVRPNSKEENERVTGEDPAVPIVSRQFVLVVSYVCRSKCQQALRHPPVALSVIVVFGYSGILTN